MFAFTTRREGQGEDQAVRVPDDARSRQRSRVERSSRALFAAFNRSHVRYVVNNEVQNLLSFLVASIVHPSRVLPTSLVPDGHATIGSATIVA